MSRFLRLLRKDLEAIRWSLGIICGVIFGLQVFLRVKLTGGWPEDLVALLLLMPVMFLPFWLLWQSFQGLRSEWREDTVYTLLSLPVAGWQITFSKLVSVLVEYSVFLAVIIGGTLVLFRPLWQDFLAVFPPFGCCATGSYFIWQVWGKSLSSLSLFNWPLCSAKWWVGCRVWWPFGFCF